KRGSCHLYPVEREFGGRGRGFSLMELVGAAGFEPTTSLEFNQGALTAELHAYALSSTYFVIHLQMDGTHRINFGPMAFVHENGRRFHAATGNWNFLSTGLRAGTCRARTR